MNYENEFFGYNRKETDDYFDYLTKANAELTEQVEQLKEKRRNGEGSFGI